MNIENTCSKIEVLHESPAISPPTIGYVKKEVKVELEVETQEEEEEEVDPMFGVAEPQFGNSTIQHLEIVPVDGSIEKKE